MTRIPAPIAYSLLAIALMAATSPAWRLVGAKLTFQLEQAELGSQRQMQNGRAWQRSVTALLASSPKRKANSISERPIFLTERDLSRAEILQMAESAEAQADTFERAWAKAMEEYQKQTFSFRERLAGYGQEAGNMRKFLATMTADDLAWVEVVNHSYRFKKIGPEDLRKECAAA